MFSRFVSARETLKGAKIIGTERDGAKDRGGDGDRAGCVNLTQTEWNNIAAWLMAVADNTCGQILNND